MYYFFKESAALEANRELSLDAEDHNHAYRVLRLRKGAPVAVADGKGAAYHALVDSIDSQAVIVRLVAPVQTNEPALRVTMLQSLTKGEKMDLMIRQAVELGVARIVPVVTQRSIPRLSGPREASRLERWRKITRAAAAQCRRAMLPQIEPVCGFDKALEMVNGQPALVPWEMEKDSGLYDLLLKLRPAAGAVLLFVGPEGGFSRSEMTALSAAGAVSVHLGPRILRAETAAITALAVIQSVWGDLSSKGGL